jgi:branched-chain amino acid transport system substrate-binding protein
MTRLKHAGRIGRRKSMSGIRNWRLGNGLAALLSAVMMPLAACSLGGTSSSGGGPPIVLGLPLSERTVGVQDHKDFLNGTNLAVDEINKAGGVLGRQLQVKVVDTDILTPEGTQAGFQALADANVDAISSPFVLIPTPALTVASAFGVPYLNGNTQQAGLDLVKQNPQKYPCTFQGDPSEIWYGSGFIPFIDSLQASGKWKPINNKVMIVEGEIAYNKTIATSLETALQATGGKWQLGGVRQITSPVNDWGPVIQNIRSAHPGVVFVDYWIAAEYAGFTKQWAVNPVPNTLVYLQYGPSQPEFLQIAGQTANGFLWSTVTGVYADQQGAAFRQKYQASNPGVMGLAYTGEGYDFTYMLANAWKAVGNTTDHKAICSYIKTHPYRGVNGWYYLNNPQQAGIEYPDQTSDPNKGMAHLFFQVQNGQHVIIGPAPYTQGQYQPQPWFTG